MPLTPHIIQKSTDAQLYPRQQKRTEEADAALKAADAESLKRLYDEAEDNCRKLVDGLSAMVCTGATSPREEPNGGIDALLAMRDVSLAAIQLAREVSVASINGSAGGGARIGGTGEGD